MPVILVTSCSNRKSIPPESRLQAADLPQASLKAVGSLWRAWLKEHPCQLAAGDLYNGRGAVEAKRAAEAAKASHWFISAGLGLVSATEEVPAYDLTVSGVGANQIKQKIEDGAFDVQAWWAALAQRRRPQRTLTRLIEEKKRSLVVLALPSNYLHMVLGDLSDLSPSSLKRLRIIGPPKPAVPEQLQPFWLPYDARLDSKESPIPGTRSDFPQRAARHFLESIWPSQKHASASTHIEAVADSLSRLPYPVTRRRKKLSDEQILRVIRRLWLRAEGQSARMLRIVRDDENIACEQSRFKNLFNQVKQQLGSTI